MAKNLVMAGRMPKKNFILFGASHRLHLQKAIGAALRFLRVLLIALLVMPSHEAARILAVAIIRQKRAAVTMAVGRWLA